METFLLTLRKINFIVLASMAFNVLEILEPKQTSVWVANGKSRRVSFVYSDEEADKWLLKVLNSKGDIVHSYPADILFPEKRRERMIYEKYVIVPENLEGGEHKIRVCALLKDKRKLCKDTELFYIKGGQKTGKLNTRRLIT